jgi:hypothetical protein
MRLWYRLRVWWMKSSVDALRHEAYRFYLDKEYAKAYIKTRQRDHLLMKLRDMGELDKHEEVRR